MYAPTSDEKCDSGTDFVFKNTVKLYEVNPLEFTCDSVSFNRINFATSPMIDYIEQGRIAKVAHE